MACQDHGKDKYMVCISCNACICSTCIDEQCHDGHIFRSFETVAKIVVKNLEKISDNVPFAELESDLKVTSTRFIQEDNVFVNSKREVLKRREQLGQLLDVVTENTITQLEKQREITSKDLDEFKLQTTEKLQKIREFQDGIERLKANDNLLEVIEQGWKIKAPEVVQLEFPKVNRLEFIPDITDKTDNIETLFGELVQQEGYAQDTIYPYGNSAVSRCNIPSSASSVCTLDLYGDGPEKHTSPKIYQDGPTDISTELKAASTSRSIKCDFNLTPIRKFDVSSAAFAMRPGVDGNVWLKCYRDDNIKLVGRDGILKYCVPCNTTVSDILVSPVTNQVMVSCPSKKCIKEVVTKQDKHFLATSTVIRTEPLAPNNICATSNGDILVTLTNKTTLSKQPNTTSVLVKYNSKGKELARVQKDVNGEDIFHIPCNICISNTGNVAIINGTTKFKGHLVVFDRELKLECRCIGLGVTVSAEEQMPDLPEKFCVNDVMFNHNNLILITEHHSRTVQLLDPLCRPLKVLISDCQAAPRSLALNTDGSVWVGFDDGDVKVYKYTCEFTSEEK
ncbi:uncharacterized protein LOC110443595 [Mizuhopecten yessoensis]|uniref:Tripartite motif-containing protein 5 n=1 Tax=Mizuhopecten yessoensis TaxID=6573 RepID=A0A210PEI9_MIZYE|nr:uncharacterized protein LOC110443595 [Mizuhopecten yessoensis]OWF34900.1 Tripartite motif-containing protein 5 [Mizuhopecten yessoensis]